MSRWKTVCTAVVSLAAWLGSSAAASAQADNDKPLLVLDTGGHTSTVKRAIFTPDGKELISVSDDKTIRVWDTWTGTPLRVLRPPIGPGNIGMIYAAALSPDGRTLAIGGCGDPTDEFGAIFLIALRSGEIEGMLKGHSSVVLSLGFSSDGSRLASGSWDRTARIWNVNTRQCEQTLAGHEHAIYGVAFSSDGKRLATASLDKSARIWSVATGQSESVLKGHKDDVNAVAWSGDGKTVATGSTDQSVRLWEADGTFRKQFDKLGNSIWSLTFSGDSSELLITRGVGNSQSQGDCSIVDAVTGKERLRFTKHSNTVLHGTLSPLFRNDEKRPGVKLFPEGQLAATCGGDNREAYVWRIADGTTIARMAGKARSISAAAWSDDGKTVAWGNSAKGSSLKANHPLERAFRLLDLDFAQNPSEGFRRGRFTDGAMSLEKTSDTTVTVQRGQENVSVLQLPYRDDVVRCFTLLSGERAVVGSSFDLRLFDARTGKVLHKFVGHTDQINAVAPSPDNRYLLSASIDQTLRIWTMDRDTPLLSLFFAGNEWIAWTPEGYYAASPGGEKFMGWHVSNGRYKMASYYPAAQFHKTFYRPDVIKRLLEAGSLDKALTLADKERGQQTRKTEVTEVLPPRVRMTFPAQSGQKIAATKFEVKTSAASVGSHPVTSLRLLVDGRPYGGEASLRTVRSAKVGEVTDAWQVDLPPGPHRLAVIAASTVSQAMSEEIDIVVAPSGAPAKPPTSNLHLLAVGINAYPGRMKLDCAVPDARAVDQAFRTHSKGVYQVQSTLLLDKDATRANFLQGIARLEKQARRGDVAVVYYAGHGDCKLAGQFVMLTVDAQLSKDRLAQTGVTGEEVKARLARLPCTVLLIMDCCYAGSFDAPGKKKRALPTQAGDLVRELVSDDHGLVVMCGASKEQESGEESKLGHGYFTLALTEGLSGKAASKRDGLVYLSGLQLYVEERVRELSNDEQYPTIGKPTLVRSFPLSKP